MALKLCRSKCCICGNVGTLFKLPNSEDRLKKWIQIFNREDILELNPNYVQNNAKVCSKHFSDWAFTGSDRKRLITFAMPETAEPPSSVLPQSIQDTAAQLLVNSDLQVGASSDSSLLAGPSSAHQLQAAVTVSSISSGVQIVPTKFLAPCPFRGRYPVVSVNPKPRVPVPPEPCDPVPSVTISPLKRTREQRIILNQRAMIYRLRKKIEKIKISFDEQLKKKLTPEMYTFVKSQIRQNGRPNKGQRWKKEDKDFALTVYKKSPSVYKLLRQKLALPSKATLRRYS